MLQPCPHHSLALDLELPGPGRKLDMGHRSSLACLGFGWGSAAYSGSTMKAAQTPDGSAAAEAPATGSQTSKCSNPAHSMPQLGAPSGEDRSWEKTQSRDQEEAWGLGMWSMWGGGGHCCAYTPQKQPRPLMAAQPLQFLQPQAPTPSPSRANSLALLTPCHNLALDLGNDNRQRMQTWVASEQSCRYLHKQHIRLL